MHWDKRYGYGPRVEIPKARAVDLRRRIKQLTTRNAIQGPHAAEIIRLKSEGVTPTEIASRLCIGRASVSGAECVERG